MYSTGTKDGGQIPFSCGTDLNRWRTVAMGKTAKYRQITDWIQNRIASGELASGEKLESEHEISSYFGVSRQTVRHALAVLTEMDILEPRQGSGTYIKGDLSVFSKEGELSRTVDIVSTYVDGYIFPKILQAMVKTLQKSGYDARIMFTNNRLETERSLLVRMLEENSRNPLIVEPVMSGLPNPNLKYYRRLRARGIPILFFHSFYPELDIPHVSIRDEQAGRLAAEYLISLGHVKIGGIFKADDGQGRRRYRGYVEALLRAGIEVREDRICWIDTQEVRDFPRLEPRIWNRLSDCTACVCYNDEVAHILTDSAREKGIQIPEQLSVVGIDNSDFARLNAVPLTSVTHPMAQLGERAAENMLRMIAEPEYDATYEFPVEIEVRKSAVPGRDGN